MADPKKPNTADVVSLGPKLPDGHVPFVRTQVSEEGTRIQGGLCKMMSSKDDVPQEYSECLHLHPISENNYEVVSSTKGPAKVNSQAFRSNWENIFGQRQTVGQA